MMALARHHEVTGVSLLTPDLDPEQTERAMRRYCHQLILLPAPHWRGLRKRVAQLRSLASGQSFERRLFDRAPLRRALDQLLRSRPFDIVNVAFPFLANQRLDQAPPGAPRPLRVLDEHNIEFDLSRQQAGGEHGLLRRLHHSRNWPKLRNEEVQAFEAFDGVTFCSESDERRARELAPSVRSAVVPNAVDVEEFRPGPGLGAPGGPTVLFFGAINYFPNVDGLLFLLKEIWPLVVRSHPRARLKIVGQHPTPEILAFRGPSIEVTGRVDDLRPHLASASVTVVPLRIGGGTRLKVLEAMAMARPVVSTSVGASGIDAHHDRELLLADDAPAFARAVGSVLDDPALGARLGNAGRALVEARYSWNVAGGRLEQFFQELLQSTAGRETPVA